MENYESQDEPREAKRKKAGKTDVNFQYCKLAELAPMLLNIFNQVLNTEADGRDHLDELNPEVVIEARLVALTNAVAYPGTVMVMCCDACITALTMLCPQRLLQVAYRAILTLNKHFYFFIFVRSFGSGRDLILIILTSLINSIHLFNFFGRGCSAHLTVILLYLASIILCILHAYARQVACSRDRLCHFRLLTSTQLL